MVRQVWLGNLFFLLFKNPPTGFFERSTVPKEGWVKNAEGRWQKGDLSAEMNIQQCQNAVLMGFTALIDYFEDIYDSFAAYALKSTLLDEENRTFIEAKIQEYKSAIKPEK